MENKEYKTFEAIHEDKILNACVDTAFTLHGDEGFTVNVLHDFLKDVWYVETSFKGKAYSLTEYTTFSGVMNYLTTKENTYLPAIGFVYDDLIYLVESKDSGVFDVSSNVMGLVDIPEEFKILDAALKILSNNVKK